MSGHMIMGRFCGKKNMKLQSLSLNNVCCGIELKYTVIKWKVEKMLRLKTPTASFTVLVAEYKKKTNSNKQIQLDSA